MPGTSYKFDEFELDSAKFELRKAGRPLKLERIPMDLLILLAERDGNVVSRQEIADRLWGKDVFVDTEHGVNVAVRKIRAALGDDADQPKFVQTVPGKGYRFVGKIPVEDFAREELDRRAGDPTEIGIPMAAPSGAGNWGAGVAALGGFLMLALAVVAFNIGGIADRMLAGTPSTQIHSIAVIPLANLSGDASQDYFADGMTDEIITMLAKNSSLRVVSRTSAMQYKGARRPLRDIASELGVDGILEGSVERTADRVHMTVQLIHAPTDNHVWAESYDRDFKDALSLPVELSETIAKKVKMPSSPQVQAQRKISPEAHNAYLHGRDRWFISDYGGAQDYFQEAIQLQPDYAAAWSGLADVYVGQAVDGFLSTALVRENALAAARQGLALDVSSGDAHHTMASVRYFIEWNWKEADAESLREVQLSPNSSEAHHFRCYVLQTLNRPDEALQEQTLASKLDPDLRPWALGRELFHLRRYGEAVNELLASVKVHPHSAHLRSILADAYHYAGREKESVHEYEQVFRSENDTDAVEAIHREFQQGGAKAVATWRLNRWKKKAARSHIDFYTLAALYSRAGRKEDALRTLESAYKERAPMLTWLQLEPDFDILHSDERYWSIVKKMGLPAMY